MECPDCGSTIGLTTSECENCDSSLRVSDESDQLATAIPDGGSERPERQHTQPDGNTEGVQGGSGQGTHRGETDSRGTGNTQRAPAGGGQSTRTLTDRLGELPLKSGALVGGSIGGLVLALAVVIAIAYPSEVVSGDFSETDAALLTLFELQFISISTMFEPITITTRLFDHFERFRPPNASLGFLYLLPILFLYRGGKFLTRRHGTDGDTLSDSALVGTSIAVGYFPVMLGAALAVPSEPVAINVTDAAVKAGILYPVLFGGMGGLVGATYPRGALRKGQAYAIGVTLLSVALVFGSTYLSIEAVPEAADALLGRLFATFFALHGALTLDLTASGMGLLPYLVVGVLFAGAGYRLVAGNDAVETPIDAFVAGTALTPTYLVAGGLLFTGAALVGTPYLFVEEVPEAYLVVRAATESGALGVVFTEGRGGVFFLLFSSIGEFVESLLLSALAYPVALGGGGGLFALRQRTDSNRQTSPQAQTRQ